MSKIKFFALGGLGENGKNMYVVEVDEKIFVLDAGLKYPTVDSYGIDAVLPDISYLVENKDRVLGIFISHGHDTHIGALPELLKVLNVGVFGTHFTISIIEDLLNEAGLNVSDYRLYRINEEKVMRFGRVNVCFYNVSHSIPEAIGIAIKTDDGTIVYAPDFTFDVNADPRYRISFNKICDIAKEGVLALCSESVGSNNFYRTTTDVGFLHLLDDALLSSKRVIISMFSTELSRIQTIINESIANKRRVAIIGRKAQKIVNIAMNSGYLKIPDNVLVNLKYIDDKNPCKKDDDDLVVIATGTRHEPFYMLQRMCKKQDRLVEIRDTDTIVLVSQPITGTEKIAARTVDEIAKSGAKLIQIQKEMLKSYHADGEDLKTMYSILKPKYLIPILGEYRHQYVQKEVAMSFGFEENRIIMLENGDVATFVNGVYSADGNKVKTGDVLIDGSVVGDIDETVLKDRELLSQEGLVVVSACINSETHKLISSPEVTFKGLTAEIKLDEINEQIKELCTSIIANHLRKHYVILEILEADLKEDVTKLIKRLIKKYPIVVITIIDINSNNERNL